MTLPGDLTTCVVTGRFLDAAGMPMNGTVTFTPTAELADPSGLVIVPKLPMCYTLSRGMFTTDPLIATDNADTTPAGWAYDVEISLQGLPPVTYAIQLPHNTSPADLSTLTPVTAQPVYTTYLTLAGGTLAGTLTLDGSPPLRIATGAASGDIFTSDSSGNGTWEAPAGVQLAADLGNTTAAPHVVSTHLASPLPVAQGGTNATTASAALTSLGAAAASAVTAETSRAEAAEATLLPLAGGTMAGAIAMGSHKVTGLQDGSNPADAAAFHQIPASLPPTGSASGDLSGTYPGPSIAKIQGTAISSPPGGTTSFLAGNGTWQTPAGSGGGISPPAGDIGGTTGSPTVAKIQGTSISSPPGGTTQYLRGDGTWTVPSGSAAASVFNVQAYGAQGNGSNDDTTAIQSAVTALEANGGGCLYFPAGTGDYKTTSTITLSSYGDGVHVMGDGYCSRIKATGNYYTFTVNAGNGIAFSYLYFDSTVGRNATDLLCTTTSTSNQVVDPHAATADVGSTITGAGIPVSTTITAVNTSTHTYTISANATASSTTATLTVTGSTSGAAINFQTGGSCRMNNVWIYNAFNGIECYNGGGRTEIVNCWIYGRNYGIYTQNPLHILSTGISGDSVALVADSVNGSTWLMSCDLNGIASIICRNTLGIAQPNYGFEMINTGANYNGGGITPPEGPAGFNMANCYGELRLYTCYGAGPGLTIGGRADACTITSGSATVTDSSIGSGDAGQNVYGTGIPAGTTISTVSAGTSFVMSANATGNGTTVNVGGPATQDVEITGGDFGGGSSSFGGPNPAITINSGSKIRITGAQIQGATSSTYDGLYIASAVTGPLTISGLQFTRPVNYAVNCNSITSGPVTITGCQFNGEWAAANPVNYPSGSASQYSIYGNDAGPQILNGNTIVTGVTAADTSIVAGGTSSAPTVRTGTLDVIAADHPPAANWSNNSHKITSLAKGTSATDAATIGQSSVYSPSVARYSGASGQAPRETLPYWAANANQTCSAGIMFLALLPVCPGDVITNIGFVCGTTGATFGSSGYHWWTALYDNTATFVAQSADQTNTAIASSHAYMLALGTGAPYTVGSGVTYLYAAVMVNTGTGGSPVQPTLRGPSQNAALVDATTSLWPTAAIASAINGSSLGATAPSGTITLAASGDLMYLGAS